MPAAICPPVLRRVLALGRVILAGLAVTGCAPTVGSTPVGPELARCEVSETSSCESTIEIAVQTFAARHPDQPPTERAVAYTRLLPGRVLPSGGGVATVVELQLADGTRRVYIVTCGVGVRVGCTVSQG